MQNAAVNHGGRVHLFRLLADFSDCISVLDIKLTIFSCRRLFIRNPRIDDAYDEIDSQIG